MSPRLIPVTAERRVTTIELAGLMLLLVVGVGFPLLVSAAAGTLEIPRNDDWSYRRIASSWHATGRLEFDAIAETMLLGQLAITQPLLALTNGADRAFTLAGLLFAIAGVCGAYFLARQLVGPGRALLAALCLVLFPGYLPYATSYMNDVPAAAAAFACVAIGAFAARGGPARTRWLVIAVAVGCFAFSIRHFALAAPAAVLVAALVAEPRNRTTWGVAMLAILATVGIQLVRSSLPGQLEGLAIDVDAWRQLPGAVVTVCFAVSPAAWFAFARGSRQWRVFDSLVGILVGIGTAYAASRLAVDLNRFPQVLLHNTTTPWGVPDANYLSGGRPLLFDLVPWIAINGIALLATVTVFGALGGALGRSTRNRAAAKASAIDQIQRAASSPAAVVSLFASFTALGMLAFGAVQPIWDRYLIPLAPAVAALILVASSDSPPSVRSLSWRRALPWAGFAASATALAVIAVAFTLNSHAFDRARWNAGVALAATGVRSDQIDAGYEWVGYHSVDRPTPGAPAQAPIWYLRWWPGFQLCGLARTGADHPPGGEEVGSIVYRRYLVAGPSEVIKLYRIDDPAC